MISSFLPYFHAIWPYLFLVFILVSVVSYVMRTRSSVLDSIPGPYIARYTDAWRCYQAWQAPKYRGLENYQMRLFEKYGEVVRIGPNTVLVNDPEAAHLVLGFKERLEKVNVHSSHGQSDHKQR